MEKINVAELLKDCPTGMQLDCIMFKQPVKYMGLTKNGTYIIAIQTSCSKFFFLTKEGYLYDTADSKCLIFPRGKTTWEGFVPPCEFKNGDVVAFDSAEGAQVFVFKEYIDAERDYVHCYMMLDDDGTVDLECGDYYVTRFATEEEKQKLFDVIKANGYKWNEETKTLEKLVEPKFKVGDKVRHKNNHNVVFTITGIEEDFYVCGAKMAFWFDDQDDYELVPNKFDITTLKPFESRVLVRDYDIKRWIPYFFGCLDNSNESPYMVVGGLRWRCCIPYEGNEHLLGKTDDCGEFYKTWE